jgi:tripartite-type tricarboxylate transporter receptor subunit TctC
LQGQRAVARRGALSRTWPAGISDGMMRATEKAHGETRMRRIRLVYATLAAMLIAGSDSGVAQENFYAGKTITVVAFGGAGNNYDTYARMLSRHLGKYIPGHPQIVVVNMPGAGGLSAANYVARVAPQDGTTIQIVSDGLLMFEATGRPGLQDSLGKFRWLGALSRANMVTATWHKSKIRTIEDARSREVRLGGSGAGAMSSTVPLLYNAFADTKFVIVQGYRSAPEQHLAMDRGELDGRGAASWTSFKNLLGKEIDEGKLHALAQIGLQREPDLSNVPLLIELARNNPQHRAVATFVSKALTLSRSVNVAPGVPDDRVALLRKAIAAVVKDAGYAAEVQKFRLDTGFVPGDEVETLVRDVLVTPKEVVRQTQAVMKIQ